MFRSINLIFCRSHITVIWNLTWLEMNWNDFWLGDFAKNRFIFHWAKFFQILSETWCVVKIMIYLRRDVSFLARHKISYQELPVHLNERFSYLHKGRKAYFKNLVWIICAMTLSACTKLYKNLTSKRAGSFKWIFKMCKNGISKILSGLLALWSDRHVIEKKLGFQGKSNMTNNNFSVKL